MGDDPASARPAPGRRVTTGALSRRVTRHTRFYLAFGMGGVAGALALGWPLTDRILLGADLFFLGYLVATGWWTRGVTGDNLRIHCADADEGGLLVVITALGAVAVSLYAITETVLNAQTVAGRPVAGLLPILALAAVPLGWATVHTVMAFHYARLFYAPRGGRGSAGPDDSGASDSGGLLFPGDCPEPGPWDFLYYSFVLGMTAQTSDISVTTTRMRRVTLAHSVLCFFYNAVIVALAVNAGMALGQGH